MLHQIEGSKAMARSIALCRPQVVCAYPITPQTHIVEGVGELVRTGELNDCEFINVESEFAALSVAIGASAAGARAYTATASQGLLFMAEAVYNAAGLGLPIVMTLGNRAIGAPINIWNDHSDAMALRESGWIQLFAESNQEAADLHIVAFRLAEELSVPTMVCVDGFILTHAVERIDVPDQAAVDAFLPPYEPMQSLDPADPISIGAMVGPDAFTEVRYLQYFKQHTALTLIEKFATEFEQRFGRQAGGLLRTYEVEGAETLIVAMGSINGTIKDVIDEMRADGVAIGLVTLIAFRPFPADALRQALARARDVVVIDRAVDVGMGGPLASNIAIALRELPDPPAMHSAIVGLGGRPTSKASLHRLFRQAAIQPWEGPHFLDLNEKVVARELHRRGKTRRVGPAAEGILKELEKERVEKLAERTS
ncbi:MAG: pyruvate ferredoxin oxidoreductase [Hyphomicrobiales bacterium]|nr:pyruvate ferredoxin oxidoreductase [Hyphomicrobiales bacterium]MBV8440325.1 pyruvate ferredoxin oxidoreductase [Hyphomicrobiales bacterium]